MLLNEKQKEAMVIELLNKGLSVREIAKQQHVSFPYIKKVRAKITGDVDKKKSTVRSIKGLQAFFEGQVHCPGGHWA
jgi:predicted transcriptional regulator